MSSTAIELYFPCRLPWRPHGIQPWRNRLNDSLPNTLEQPESDGHSRQWSTSLATPAGVGLSKVPAKIHIWVQQWRVPRFVGFRANRLGLTLCWPVLSILPATALLLGDAIMMRRTFLKNSFATSTCLRSSRQSSKAL